MAYPKHDFTKKDINKIRKRLLSGVTIARVAVEFGISPPTLYAIGVVPLKKERELFLGKLIYIMRVGRRMKWGKIAERMDVSAITARRFLQIYCDESGLDKSNLAEISRRNRSECMKRRFRDA